MSQGVSVRGSTYDKVKAKAKEQGVSIAELVQRWLQQYPPFGTRKLKTREPDPR